MATDYSIMEEDLKSLLTQLKRDLHMREVRKLSRKYNELSKRAMQNKQIKLLTQQVAELEPTVSTLYCAQHHLRDNQIKGYIIYLLQLKDYFSSEVKTKMEIIQKRNQQIKTLVVRLCTMRNEYAKKLRNLPKKSAEFIKLENMSDRMNQIEKRLSILQNENKELRENILDMAEFQRQFKKFEREFQSKNEALSFTVQQHLENAVAIYEEREVFVNKAEVFHDRYLQDLRKALLNQNSLDLVLEKTQKYKDFDKLQNEEKTDSRIAVTGDLIDKKVTGLEPALKKEQYLYMDIAKSAHSKTPKQIKEHFRLTEDKTSSKFSYLEQILEEINHTQKIVNELKYNNMNLLKNIKTSERKLRWDISVQQAKVGKSKLKADVADKRMIQSREKLDDLLKSLWKIFEQCGFDPAKFEEHGIDDSNANAIKSKVEKQIVQFLMLIEYLQMKDDEAKESEITLIADNEDIPLVEEASIKEFLDVVQPRILDDENQEDNLAALGQEKTFSTLEQLKRAAVIAVTKLETVKDADEDE